MIHATPWVLPVIFFPNGLRVVDVSLENEFSIGPQAKAKSVMATPAHGDAFLVRPKSLACGSTGRLDLEER